ncbi:hypothetical protein [Deinococcus planocerae]|nr:hypothetical protein [Deinococcus planocerae]
MARALAPAADLRDGANLPGLAALLSLTVLEHLGWLGLRLVVAGV